MRHHDYDIVWPRPKRLRCNEVCKWILLLHNSWGGITIMSLNSVSPYNLQMTIAVFCLERAKANSYEDKKGTKFWCNVWHQNWNYFIINWWVQEHTFSNIQSFQEQSTSASSFLLVSECRCSHDRDFGWRKEQGKLQYFLSWLQWS